ncbi:hypothetical protein ABGT23_01985 [Enterobacter cloacae]|uniref:hypothetical protein n=1 Tax=Enterobacter cloacae TaxID=550 RepID=UPI00345CFC6C
MSIIRKYATSIVLMLTITPGIQAATVDGYFSEWYYTGPNAPLALDYHYSAIIIDESDEVVTNKVVRCNDTYLCYAGIYRREGNSRLMIERKRIAVGGDYSVADFNQKLAAILPLSGQGKVTGSPNNEYCVIVELSTGWKNQIVADSCKNLGPIAPPIPSVPVTCDIEGLNNSIVDFGRLNTNEDARKTITASLRCTGDESAKGSAELKLEGTDPAQKNYAILNNISGMDQIKVRMTIGNSNSNTETVTVKAGWSESRDLNFYINSSELAGKTGEFTGSAILTFRVL